MDLLDIFFFSMLFISSGLYYGKKQHDTAEKKKEQEKLNLA